MKHDYRVGEEVWITNGAWVDRRRQDSSFPLVRAAMISEVGESWVQLDFDGELHCWTLDNIHRRRVDALRQAQDMVAREVYRLQRQITNLAAHAVYDI